MVTPTNVVTTHHSPLNPSRRRHINPPGNRRRDQRLLSLGKELKLTADSGTKRTGHRLLFLHPFNYFTLLRESSIRNRPFFDFFGFQI